MKDAMRRKEKPPQTIVHKDHSVIIPPPTLRDRVMSIGTGTKDGFDKAALERAEEALAALATDFSAWMRDETTRLEAASEIFRAAPSDPDKQQVLYRAAHDIRGQGRTFGYALAGEIADGLCDLIEGAEEMDADVLELIDAHIDAIRAVVRDDIRDGTDKVARNLIDGLRTAREAIIGVNRFVKIAPEAY